MPQPKPQADHLEAAPQGRPTPIREWVRRLGPFSVLAVMAASLPAIGAALALASVPSASAWLRESGWAGPWIYAAGFTALAGLALLPTWLQSALGGYAFGLAVGGPAALAGCVGGSIVGYEIARAAGGDRVMSIVRKNPKLAAVRDALISDDVEHGFWRTTGIVALVRLPTSSPFAMTNILLASLKVPRICYLVGTAAGMAPRTAVAVWIGHSVGMASSGEFAIPKWAWIAGTVAMIVAAAVMVHIGDKALKRLGSGAEKGG